MNNSPTKPSRMEGGLRQRDSLSPFLFVLAAEVLNRLIPRAEEKNMIKGMQIGSDVVNLSHLQFADNTILICPARYDIFLNYRHILDCFGMMSGPIINYEKSAMVPIHCDNS